jgi:SAM-dependent methyltransferase
MPNLKTRSYEKELLDSDHVPFSDMLTTVQELNVINTLLGGHNITLRGVDYFLSRIPADKKLVIAEIGCGGGDNLTVIHKFLEKRKQPFSLVGIDIKPGCIYYAGQHAAKGATWICADYRNTQWPDGKPDIIFSSLFCHHFTDEQLAEQLAWLRENSNLGFFINDLHRHALAYHSIKVLTRIFSRSRLVRNDAPLSVKRGFRRHDWERILTTASISPYRISWHWAFRYLVCVAHER